MHTKISVKRLAFFSWIMPTNQTTRQDVPPLTIIRQFMTESNWRYQQPSDAVNISLYAAKLGYTKNDDAMLLA